MGRLIGCDAAGVLVFRPEGRLRLTSCPLKLPRIVFERIVLPLSLPSPIPPLPPIPTPTSPVPDGESEFPGMMVFPLSDAEVNQRGVACRPNAPSTPLNSPSSLHQLPLNSPSSLPQLPPQLFLNSPSTCPQLPLHWLSTPSQLPLNIPQRHLDSLAVWPRPPPTARLLSLPLHPLPPSSLPSNLAQPPQGLCVPWIVRGFLRFRWQPP